MSTQYILAATGGDYSAYPLRKADFTDWADDAVDLVEEGSTGKYASDVLHRGFGDQWAVFNKTVASGAPSAWTDAVDKIDLGDAGGWLNVCRDTPYGVLLPRDIGYSGDPIQNAVNWALKYQGVEDPASRVPAGGPEGCFTPYIPKCDKDGEWYSTGQWFVPNRRGVELRGGGHFQFSDDGGTNTGGAARVRFDLADDTKPAIINQSGGWNVSDISFLTRASTAVCILNHQITSTGDTYYVANNGEGFGTGSSNTQPCSRLVMERCDISNFGIGIQNGGSTSVSNCDHHTLINVSFNECGTGWKNVNDQGVNLKFMEIQNRDTDIVFDFQAGGFMHADHVLSAYSDTKILNIGTRPGKNNGYFRLSNIKTDTEATDGAWIVYMDTTTNLDRWVTVFLDGVQNARRVGGGSTDQQTRFARMVGRSSLVVENCIYPGFIECYGGEVTSGAYKGSTFAPNITLSNCQFGSEADAIDPWRLIDGTVNSYRVNGCNLNIGFSGSPPRTLPSPVHDRTYTTIFTG